MESLECSSQPSLGEVCPKTPSVNEELDEKKAVSPLRPKTPNSPDPNCAICLGKLHNTSFTDSCLHQFCFTCLQEWSKVKPECPLCKQTFKSIIHNVRSIEDYDQYHLLPAQPNLRMWSLNMEMRRRSSFFSTGMWHTPTLVHEPRFRGMFSGDDAVIPSMNRVSLFRIREVVSSEFRRSIYDRNVWAEPLYDVTGRFRECTAEFFRQNEAAVHRLIPWLNRELDAVLCNGVNKSHVLELILSLLPRFNINSSEFRSQLASYFREHVTHFLHEFYNFARSPYDMIGFDRSVIYSVTGQRPLLIVSSDESDGDDDVMVLSSPERSSIARPELSVRMNRNAEVAAVSSQPMPIDYEQVIDQLARREVENDIAINSDSTVDLEVNDADSDCLIVGFVKPRNERTPEIVTLVSDEEHQSYAEDISRRTSHSCESTASSDSSRTAQTSDSDYSPSKSHSKCRKKKKLRKVRKDSKMSAKEKSKKTHRYTTHKSRKSTSSSASRVKKLKRMKELFSSSSSLSSSSSSSCDEELRPRKRIQRDKKSHCKGTWHARLNYEEEGESHRDHNYITNHNPPYNREEIDAMQQLQNPRNPPKLKSIVITRTYTDTSPSVSGSSSHHQSRASSSKRSHSHRSSHKRSKHDKNRSGKSDKRKIRFSSSDTSACKAMAKKFDLYSSGSDGSS